MRILLFSLLFCFSSCARVFVFLLGGKMPQIETFESIKGYAEKWDIDSSDVFLLNPEFLAKHYYGTGNRTFLFDRNGYSIDLTLVGEDPRCGGNIFGLMKGLGKQTYAKRDSQLTLNSILNYSFHITGKQAPNVNKAADYYILFYWNCFTGKQRNKETIEMLKESISNNSKVETQLFVINKDIYEGVDWEKVFKRKK